MSGPLIRFTCGCTAYLVDGKVKSYHELCERHGERSNAALAIIESFGGIDGDHHKAWVLDQVVRVLTGAGYAQWVAAFEDGEHGPQTYSWNTGIAP